MPRRCSGATGERQYTRRRRPVDPIEMIGQIEKYSTAFEMTHVRTFKGYRQGKDGENHAITVQVHERPPGAGTRYYVVVTDDRGCWAWGDGGPTLDVALAAVHWHRL